MPVSSIHAVVTKEEDLPKKIIKNAIKESDLPLMSSGDVMVMYTDNDSVFSMASLYSSMREIHGIWQIMVYELLEKENNSIKRIAADLRVSPRTVKRILGGQTSKPSIRTSYNLFEMHAKACPESYKRLLRMAQENKLGTKTGNGAPANDEQV